MHLTDGILAIRNATTKDAEVLCRWWNDGSVMEHAGFPHGLGTTVEQIRAELAIDADEQHQRLIIENDSVPVGEMSYRWQGDHVVEIGIKICDITKQNKGYGTSCLTMLIEWLFSKRGCEKIVLDTNLKNVRAQYVYESVGFRRISINYNTWKNQVGELQSSVDYELTKSNYLTLIRSDKQAKCKRER